MLDPPELQTAKEELFLPAQQESFPEEFNSLCSSSHVAKRSKPAPFAPFVGTGELLRSRGRTVRFPDLQFGTKHPILLDAKHPLVRLFLVRLHEENHYTWAVSIFEPQSTRTTAYLTRDLF